MRLQTANMDIKTALSVFLSPDQSLLRSHPVTHSFIPQSVTHRLLLYSTSDHHGCDQMILWLWSINPSFYTFGLALCGYKTTQLTPWADSLCCSFSFLAKRANRLCSVRHRRAMLFYPGESSVDIVAHQVIQQLTLRVFLCPVRFASPSIYLSLGTLV